MRSQAENIGKYVGEHGPKVVLEVGAHVGAMTECWLNLGAERVLALEPTPHLFDEHVKRFAGDFRVTTYQLAVSDDVFLHKAMNLFNCYTLLPHDTTIQLERGAPYKDTPPFQVEFTTIDRFLLQHDVRPDFVKIDVDGFEARAMRGSRHLLRDIRPLILFELSYLPTYLGDCCECMLRDLFDMKYRIRSMVTEEVWTDVKAAMRHFPWDTSFDVLLEPIS